MHRSRFIQNALFKTLYSGLLSVKTRKTQYSRATLDPRTTNHEPRPTTHDARRTTHDARRTTHDTRPTYPLDLAILERGTLLGVSRSGYI